MTEFERISKLLNRETVISTEQEIQSAIEQIEQRLNDKEINKYKNFSIKEGYERALQILKKETSEFEDLKTIQGMAIADMARCFLEGRYSVDLLCGVPLKK